MAIHPGDWRDEAVGSTGPGEIPLPGSFLFRAGRTNDSSSASVTSFPGIFAETRNKVGTIETRNTVALKGTVSRTLEVFSGNQTISTS